MDELFSLDLCDSIIASDYVNSTSFKEFCNDLNNLNNLDMLFTDDLLYTEKYVDPNLGTRKKVGKTLKNTRDTISNTVSIYGRTTDVGGSTIKALWDLAFNAINLISKIILWFLEKINTIPRMITNLIKGVGEIPDNIKAMIMGNIKLHITADDIGVIYNQGLIRKIDDFIGLLKIFRDGETWSTFFKRRVSIKTKQTKNGEKIDIIGTITHPIDNDMKIGRKMEALYKDLEHLGFKETIIDMKDKKNIKMYFSNEKNIKFVDLRGTEHHSSYFEAIAQLVNDLKSRSSELKSLREDIGDKFNSSEGQQQFARLNQLQQQRITQSIRIISKVVSIVGNLTKSIIQDMVVIDKAVDKLIKRKKLDKIDDPRKDSDEAEIEKIKKGKE